VSQSLIAFDTDHIKQYVFGTNKLKEIRGASSILDHLNRVETVKVARAYSASPVFAHGGSALFLIDAEQSEGKAEELGKAVQRLYREKTGNAASITYAVQRIPDNTKKDIMTATELNEYVTMKQVLDLLRLRLQLAKNSHQTGKVYHAEAIALPTHAFLCTCKSCGVAYAEDILLDPGETDSRYCRVCIGKRREDDDVKKYIPGMIGAARSRWRAGTLEEFKLWERILRALVEPDPDGALPYRLSGKIERPRDFQAFRELTAGKSYLGLIYADANNMGKAIEKKETLKDVQDFAVKIDQAVFKAMADAIKELLPVQDNMLPFDALLVGGDDIVMVVPADKALQVAHTLAEKFHEHTKDYTLSVGVVLAPISYPFNLQRTLAEDILKDAKKAGARSSINESSKGEKNESYEEARISFVVITGSTSLSYGKIRDDMLRKFKTEEFYATMRPYTLKNFAWLLDQLKEGRKKHLGHTKLYQLREAILKMNRTTTILEALALFRNWQKKDREFIRAIVREFDTHLTPQERNQRGTFFPWYLEITKDSPGKDIYRTPLLDFIELYDFISS
jgi:hypothetical protein